MPIRASFLLGLGKRGAATLDRRLPGDTAVKAIFSGIICVAIVACGAASSPSSETNGPDAATDGPNPSTVSDGGWKNGCSPTLPIRWYVNNTNHENPEPLRDECEALPAQCASDGGLTDPREMDTASTCECVVAIKNAKNDAGATACPGNGPIYCDVLDDRSLVVRCSPP